jgi:hypothetical protein
MWRLQVELLCKHVTNELIKSTGGDMRVLRLSVKKRGAYCIEA